MIFHPKNRIQTEERFVLPAHVSALAHTCLNKPILQTFWHNFSYRSSSLTLSTCNEFVFSVGDAERLALDGAAYSIHVTPNGICVYAENERDLIHGFLTLLDRFHAIDENGETAVEVACCQIRERALVQTRMIHYCIFPETELWELQRFVRFCGALKYTHIVLEFWGMLKYDCMQELSWSHGFTKEEVRPILSEARALGLEVIPMFNHWGHASAGRVMHGKHVVLDQNPALQSYFSEDGWCWDIRQNKVRALLRQIREELIELCGEGTYFHIGCDEAFNFEFTKENMDFLCDFINEASRDLIARGRRAILWGDMFLYRYEHYNPNNRYTCNAPTREAEQYLLGHLDRQIVMADWQYRAPEAPVETVSVFKKAGFDCLFCPWDEGRAQIDTALITAKSGAVMGYMHTTWHTLSKGFPIILLMGVGGFEEIHDMKGIKAATYSAALLRRVMPIDGNYERAGWGRYEVGCRW